MSEQPALPLHYELRTVSDFLALPPEKVGACLIDFCRWIEVVRWARSLETPDVKIRTPIDVFGWVDDGKHEMTVTVSGPDGTEIARKVETFAPPE